MDTPGVHKARTKLGEHMNKAVRDSAAGVELILMMADVTKKIGENETNIINSFHKNDNVILILNKIDLVKNKDEIAAKIAEYSSLYGFKAVIPISVKENDGIDIVREEVKKYTVEGPHYFPDDKFTDQPEQTLVSEMIREKILQLMFDEIPHGIAVTVEKMSERRTSSKV